VSRAYARFERVLAEAMQADDPAQALRAASRDRALDARTRGLLGQIDPDGARLAALLVARLRFERLMRGSPEAELWFDTAPEEFAQAFRRYHREVPPTAFFPPGEAALFRAWRESLGAPAAAGAPGKRFKMKRAGRRS
jgi:hypothetical protein